MEKSKDNYTIRLDNEKLMETFKILILANPFENTVASFRVNSVFLDGSTAIFLSRSFYEKSEKEKIKILFIIIAEDIHSVLS